ncbi:MULTISPECIES: SEC-C metal-binding domain-containing protein [Halomonadaceae]|uniref:SEC-C metal-binding domain-containing protein n=1 Tax=Halomonadaceae TaxID=28256 RepID=UPI001D1844B6|nr:MULTISPECIES: SEC-C domain-containing protein [Halomonas]MCC4289501.1 SEC-C domain-containing protein [Halomonas meridiana]MCP1305500.1 SEC-C domain-containing protein [Halomonas sp. R1t8]MCP1331995.1 SEC-C domain-containing protein [Halomonas sp. R1t4]
MLAVWVDQLLGFASGALSAIRQQEHYPDFMTWVRDKGAQAFNGDVATAQALAPILWSQTPLERLDFASEPLATPGRNEPCWCDSGRKYKQCCYRVNFPTDIPEQMMWMLSLREWKGATLKAALDSQQAPPQALLEAGLIAAESGQTGRSMQILESLFDGSDWSRLPEQAEPAFEILLDIYQERGFTRKRADLLDDVMERGPLFLRGVALERLCLMHLDNDDLDSARAAFVKAQQALPDSPTLAYIEAMLLLHEGHEKEAKERANFWYRRLVRQGDLDEDQLDFLAALADNPGATLADQLLSAEEDMAMPLVSLQALLAALPVAPKLSIEQDAETGRLHYTTTAREETLFAAWHEQFQVMVDEEVALGFRDDPWVNAIDWMSALCAHPEWLDAPQVVQDLTLALTSRFGSLPWMAPSLLEPLALRLSRWLEQARAAGDGSLCWDDVDNVMLLRTGLALVVGMERGARQHSRELAEELLAIDQEDSLGLKELVLDQLLRDDRNEEALALTEEPQKDDGSLVLGLLMGRTLALYRLGQQEAAEAALAEVVAHNRHALELICAENPRPSMPHPDGQVDPGSRAEAWQYRTLMRDQWRTTPGALDWLASHR